MKRAAQAKVFNLNVEFSRETDGRWMASIPALPGITAHARTRKDARTAAEALALRAMIDRMKHNEAALAS